MKIWINKKVIDKCNEDFSDSFIFSLTPKNSTIYTNISDLWLRLGQLSLKPIYEDLFIISLAVFAIDKRIPRKLFSDNWTRELEVCIPVIEYEKLSVQTETINEMLTYLTGDVWQITFRKTSELYSKRKRKSRKTINIDGCDCVCLFSGGLDSYCGSISLLNENKNLCLFGYNEYPKLRYIQEELSKILSDEYKNNTVKFLSFTANSHTPVNNKGENIKSGENTSRGRSLLFLSGAITIAGILGSDTPVYIPENGFIGVNVSLTDSRKGSCSTRTTHPYFLDKYNKLLMNVGIRNKVINPFAYLSKREIVEKVHYYNAFSKGFAKTISCSHPCQARWNGGGKYPINCGYCYPCIIRKCSLMNVDTSDEEYTFKEINGDFIRNYSHSDKGSDTIAVINSVYRYNKSSMKDIRRFVSITGPLSENEINKFLNIYTKTMKDLISMFSVDEEISKMIGE